MNSWDDVLSSFFHGRAKRKSLDVFERSPDKSIDTKDVEYSRRAFLRLVAASAAALPMIFLGVDRLLSRQNGAQGLESTSPPTVKRFFYPIVGTSWDSDATWKNGISRILTRDSTSTKVSDPYDPKLLLGGGPRPVMIIDGKGTGTLTGKEVDNYMSSSNRLIICNSWTNTETTLDLSINDTTTSLLHIRSRSKHTGSCTGTGTKCDFGNYLDTWAFLQHSVSHGIELIHPIYKRKIGLKTIEPLPRNKWLSFKSVCRTITGQNKVLLESYISHDPSKNEWIKMVSTTFGTNESFTPEQDYDQELVDSCIGQGDKTVDNLNNHFFAGPATSIMIRLDKCKNIKIKSFSIREIAPIGTTPTPGFDDPNLAPTA